ncbi:hypothetical protein BH747_04070 [Enterococcus villorum]|uniref:Uncharacterized protein n=1 Tax=Enterococcus villorum TaxID=112904 RepID=A0A1V8YR69_9ENTE|nr:hypothetical protein [Enterococcus villorum]OQO71172.1 hypothetical protein BH747_04070 [Enterococcus villorum]OQO74998.1 hypothetical protein BH744_06340 [Enterococcus villorum]
MKVKIMQGITDISEYAKRFVSFSLEHKVQQFLDENPQINIHDIKQSSSSSDNGIRKGVITIISIWYEEASNGN